MTVEEVKGFGRQKGHTELYRGAEYSVDFSAEGQDPNSWCPDDKAAKVVEVITDSCPHRQDWRRKDLCNARWSEVIRIRTGEKGQDAI